MRSVKILFIVIMTFSSYGQSMDFFLPAWLFFLNGNSAAEQPITEVPAERINIRPGENSLCIGACNYAFGDGAATTNVLNLTAADVNFLEKLNPDDGG